MYTFSEIEHLTAQVQGDFKITSVVFFARSVVVLHTDFLFSERLTRHKKLVSEKDT